MDRSRVATGLNGEREDSSDEPGTRLSTFWEGLVFSTPLRAAGIFSDSMTSDSPVLVPTVQKNLSSFVSTAGESTFQYATVLEARSERTLSRPRIKKECCEAAPKQTRRISADEQEQIPGRIGGA